MNPFYAYFFLAGLCVGGYTNTFSKVVISGLVLYIFHPENFDPRRFSPLYLRVYDFSYPYLSKIYSFSSPALEKIANAIDPEDIPKISIIKTPLPPLRNKK